MNFSDLANFCAQYCLAVVTLSYSSWYITFCCGYHSKVLLIISIHPQNSVCERVHAFKHTHFCGIWKDSQVGTHPWHRRSRAQPRMGCQKWCPVNSPDLCALAGLLRPRPTSCMSVCAHIIHPTAPHTAFEQLCLCLILTILLWPFAPCLWAWVCAIKNPHTHSQKEGRLWHYKYKISEICRKAPEGVDGPWKCVRETPFSCCLEGPASSLYSPVKQ